MTTIQFTEQLWRQSQPIGYIGVVSLTAWATNSIGNKIYDKKRFKEGQVIHPQETSVEELQHLYTNEGLSEDDWNPNTGDLRHLPT